jgi:hypothetical protein
MKKFLTVVALALAALTATIAAVPGTASAAVRTGFHQDPQGDASALDGSPLDLKSVAVRYDDSLGSVRVTWAYYGDVRTGSQLGGFFSATRGALPIDQFMINWFGDPNGDGSWSFRSELQVVGVSGSLSGIPTVSPDGRVVTAEFTNRTLAGHDWRQSAGSTGAYDGDEYGTFWFDGYSDPTPITVPGDSAPTTGSEEPDANQGMTINGGALYTNDPDVTLSVVAPDWADSLRIANDGGFRAAQTFGVKRTIRWRLAESGRERLPKTVYLRFGSDAQTFTDDIILDQTKPTVRSATVGTGGATTSEAVTAIASKARTYRVRVRAKDATSGVAKVQFAVRSKRHPSALRKFKRISRYTGARAPRYVRVRDRAGNFSRWRSIRLTRPR